MAAISLRGVAKTYDNGFQAVRGIDLEIADREFMVLVGPSGCGKTTTLRMIAGLEDCTTGELAIGGRVVNDVAPKDRDIAMVFQSYALYPHMNVRDNMAFGLQLRRVAKEVIAARVAEAARMLSLEAQLGKLPKQLSGGQRQRVALGRAIVRQPQAFLFDEPLSNLDAKLRGEMRYELKTLQQRLQATMVYVTHDQVEAMTLGDRITVMDQGAIQQVAPPMELYDQPANRFVAGFIGSPGMNFLDGEVQAGGVFRLPGGQALTLAMPAAPRLAPGPAVLGLRPEHLVPADHGLPAQVRVVELMGDHAVVYAEAAGCARPLVLVCDGHRAPRAGTACALACDTARAHVFAADGEHAANLTLTRP